MDVKTFLTRSRPTVLRVMGKLLLLCRTIIRSLLRNGAVFPINGKLRDEWLNETLISSMAEAHETLEGPQEDYYYPRPHWALGTLTPMICKENQEE